MRLMNAPATEPDEPSKDDFLPSFRYWIILKVETVESVDEAEICTRFLE